MTPHPAVQTFLNCFRLSATQHFRTQRLTAMALVPLSLVLLVFLYHALHTPYAETVAWLASPLNGLALLLWTVAVFFHAALGVQVVIEDYVSDLARRHRALHASAAVFAGVGLLCVLLLMSIILGA
jgi:succinate dehydrogenase / fumarate reductase membrane anchor subunit